MVPVYDKNHTFEYTLTSDTEEPKTIFHLGVLDIQEHRHLTKTFDSVQVIGSGDTKTQDKQVETSIKVDKVGRDIETVALKLKGVENFGDATLSFRKKLYPFGERSVLTEDSLNMVKPYVEELANAIRERSSFTKEDAKN